MFSESLDEREMKTAESPNIRKPETKFSVCPIDSLVYEKILVALMLGISSFTQKCGK